jgi:hypothetical protein
MHLQAAVVVNEAELPKLVHEETHPGPPRSDHFCQGFLTDPGHDRLMLPVFAEAGQQQENPRQPLLAGIEQLINQVLFDPTFRDSRYDMKSSDNAGSLWSRTIVSFCTRRIEHSVIAVAVAMRSGCPARLPSPKKSPLPKIATTASFPRVERTVSFTLPFSM